MHFVWENYFSSCLYFNYFLPLKLLKTSENIRVGCREESWSSVGCIKLTTKGQLVGVDFENKPHLASDYQEQRERLVCEHCVPTGSPSVETKYLSHQSLILTHCWGTRNWVSSVTGWPAASAHTAVPINPLAQEPFHSFPWWIHIRSPPLVFNSVYSPVCSKTHGRNLLCIKYAYFMFSTFDVILLVLRHF